MKTHEYDIVIIGSGAGGGTVAKELAPLCEKGRRIALLEWGGRFQKKDNTRREIEMARKYYFDSGGFQTQSQDMTLAFAHGVGGSTNVYTGVTFKLPQPVYDHWGIKEGDYREFDRRMEKYMEECHVHLLPEDQINRNNQLFKNGVKKLGWEVGQFPLNIKNCVGLNTCNLGCARHAKQGTAVVQIPQAEQAGVEIVPFCRVDHIAGNDIFAKVVPPHMGLQPSPWEIGSHRIRAKTIVLAAGAINSSAILLRSFGSKPYPTLGKYLTCHPALMIAAEQNERVNGMQGHPKSYYCDRFVENERFLLETCMYFPFSLAKNLAGFGREPDELLSRYPYIQMILTLILDRAKRKNRVEVDRKGRPIVHYEIDREIIQAFVASVRASARIFFAAGAKRAHLPGTKAFFTYADQVDDLESIVQEPWFKPGKVSLSAAHLMGGCRMGREQSDSVTDTWGKLHAHDHIFVADASLFPTCSEVNPYLTIMALADRVAERVRTQW